VTCNGLPATVVGTNNNDTISGTPRPDVAPIHAIHLPSLGHCYRPSGFEKYLRIARPEIDPLAPSPETRSRTSPNSTPDTAPVRAAAISAEETHRNV